MNDFQREQQIIEKIATSLPKNWEGKEAVLELKEAEYNWKQNEWPGFYFDYHMGRILKDYQGFRVPGDEIRNTKFDATGVGLWEWKTKAITSKGEKHVCILNDKEAMDEGIRNYGSIGIALLLIRAEADKDGMWRVWHNTLKGEPSNYVKNVIRGKSVRKTRVETVGLYILRVDETNLHLLNTMKQGRNSNEKARPLKYKVDIRKEEFVVNKIIWERQ